jgi:hypothetical protein
MRRWLLAAMIVALPAPAMAAPSNDALIELGRKATVMHMDLLATTLANGHSTSSGSPEFDCLVDLSDASGELDNALDGLSALATISSMMKAKADAEIVEHVVQIRSNTELKIITIERSQVARPMGRCSNSPLVIQKGQLLLDFMQNVTDQLSR